MKSLDPRVTRLHNAMASDPLQKVLLDQWITFEVFVQPVEKKPFQHEGIVHAPNVEMAFVLAKESLTRRFQCVSIFVTDTRNVFVSPTTEGNENVYDQVNESRENGATLQFEIFHLMKRGKQHIHVGQVTASSPKDAFLKAKEKYNKGVVYNVWIIETAKIRFTAEHEKEIWKTLPEKKFRDASDYKGGDKLKKIMEMHHHKTNEH